MEVNFPGVHFWGGSFLTVVERMAIDFFAPIECFGGEPILNVSNRETDETTKKGIRLGVPWGEGGLVSQYFIEIRPLNSHSQYSSIEVNIVIEKDGEDHSLLAPKKIKELRNILLEKAMAILEEKFVPQ